MALECLRFSNEHVTTSVKTNRDLYNIDRRANQWKMFLNPDPSK